MRQSFSCATSNHDDCNGTVLGAADEAMMQSLREAGQTTDCACICHGFGGD